MEPFVKKYHLGHRGRLMQKFLMDSSNFSNVDLLELVLFLTIPRKDTKQIANKLNEKFNEQLLPLFSASLEDLQAVDGLGMHAILFLKLVHKLAQKISMEQLKDKNYLSSFSDLINYCKLKMGTKKHEELRVIFLTAKNSIIKDEVLFYGTLTSVSIHPREIVKKCLDYGAAGIIMVHNHPSGEPTPSFEDIEITKNLARVLKSLNITLCDHLIFGGSSFLSFKQNKIAPFT